MANGQSHFLLEEYKQLHESLYRSNEAIVTAVRFTITLLAASSGAILVACMRGDNVDTEGILTAIAILSFFFCLICFLGSFFLLNSFRNVRRMFSAINAIRSYYVSTEHIPREFVVMPLRAAAVPRRLFGAWPAMYLANIFAMLFLLLGIIMLYLLVQPDVAIHEVILFCVAPAMLFWGVHAYLIEKALSKAAGESGGVDSRSVDEIAVPKNKE